MANMNPHALRGGATYRISCPFRAMSLAAKIGGTVFRYALGTPFGEFEYAVSKGDGAILFNKRTWEPCDKYGNPITT